MLNTAFVLAQSSVAKAPTETLVVVSGSARHTFEVEVAETEAQKARGLMFRTSVPKGTGMLFPHDGERELTMWMRNTYVSLDMLFIRADGTIHRIAANTEPMSEDIIASEGAVSAVLELGAGEAKRLGIKPGDRVNFRTFKSQ
ncbi:MAG: DUF192 domain-containing protein [Pseudomonadota bacterium]